MHKAWARGDSVPKNIFVTIAMATSAVLMATPGVAASRLGGALLQVGDLPPDVTGLFVHTAEADESRAQTFTLDRSGTLGEITLRLFDSPNAPQGIGPLADPIALEVRPTVNGVPLGAASVLGHVALNRSDLDLPRTEPLTFDFTPLGIQVARGDRLAFVLGPGSGGTMGQLISQSGREVYAGGSSFIARDFSDAFEDRGIDYDFSFQVVPEPGTALLLALGLALLSRPFDARR